MVRTNLEIQGLERDAYRIVGMICSEAVPEDDVQAAIRDLRRRTQDVFPEQPGVFDQLYGRRFARLRTRFRPALRLF
jgi:hypothetical protein